MKNIAARALLIFASLLSALGAPLQALATSPTKPPVGPAYEVVTYYHNDLAGSPLAATDEDAFVLWREDFTPFGERVLQQTNAGDNHRWFTGHPHNDDTGLTYAGARHYDPMLGRFMSVDPVGVTPENQFSFSRYAYGNNNPYAYNDPNGEFPTTIAVPVGIVALAAACMAVQSCREGFKNIDWSAPLLPDLMPASIKDGKPTVPLIPMDRGGIAASPPPEDPEDWQQGTSNYTKGKNDLDWRGSSKTYREALDEAFRRTGQPRSEFTVESWAPGPNGKDVPVSWKHPSGAKVELDFGHWARGPSNPHVGWRAAGKQYAGGGQRGHILLDKVPAGRYRPPPPK